MRLSNDCSPAWNDFFSSGAQLTISFTTFRSSLQCYLLGDVSSGYLIYISISLVPLTSQPLPYFSAFFSLTHITICHTLYYTFRFYLLLVSSALESKVYISWWHWFLHHSLLCSLYPEQCPATSCSMDICWIKEWIWVGIIAVCCHKDLVFRWKIWVKDRFGNP